MANAAGSVVVAQGDTIDTVLRQLVLNAVERRMLVAHALGMSRVALITQSDTALDAAQAQRIAILFERRSNGEPIAYLLGLREFHGLDFEVSPSVLIPRADTELLVDLAIERLPRQGSVLDMGTGSGAIAVAIGASRRDAHVTATDLSDAALTVARRNAARHAVQVRLLRSDWFAAVTNEKFTMIVSNPPYIAAGDPHLAQGDLRFEPVDALTDHHDGLSALRKIIHDASHFLDNDGWLLLEHGYDQADAVRALLNAAQFHEIQSWRDLAGIERVSGGRKLTRAE
jgi:release factor glutamine methyltransferase